MAYLGRGIENLSDRVVLDALTASATASYTLQLNSVNFVPSSAESLTVSLNGVIQKPDSSYTVSGSTLTFSSALTSSDSIDFIIAERGITLQTPSAGSVNTDQLASTAVTTAKIASTAVTPAKMDLSQDYTFTGKVSGQNYPAFSAKMSSDQGLSTNVNTKLNFNSELIDTDSAYDATTNYRFTVPSGKAGKYVFSLQVFARGQSVGNFNYICLKIYKNGSQLLTAIHNDNNNQGFGATGNVVVMDDANVGDYYEPYILADASSGLTIDIADQGGCDHFYGYRIGD